jgi:glycosyltransferase involved in cell wall biosynthesis
MTDVPPTAQGTVRGISAVIPTFNRGRLLERAVESVVGQSRPADEIIVVDDGSTDDTPERIQRFAGAVRYFRQDNAGGAAARNRGVSVAEGEWVAFLDSDDLWQPDHLEVMERAIASTNGRAACYFADMQNPPGSSHASRWRQAGFHPRTPFECVPDGTEWVMIEYQPMMLQASVLNKRIYQEIGGLWEELRTAHDTHFFLKVGIGHQLCAVAGGGARQTADDDETSRLTTRKGPVRSGRLHNRIALCQDILHRFPSLPAPHRATLHRRIGSARWSLARAALKEGNVLLGGRLAGQAAAALWTLSRGSSLNARRSG